MSVAHTRAARVRGVLVGASSGAVAVAAHSVGGTELPATPSIVLLVLACAVVGAVASCPNDLYRRLPIMVGYLSAGQLVGHTTLVLASPHGHADHWSAAMALAHLCAAIGCAALICTVERLVAALAAVLWRLVVVLAAVRDQGRRRPVRPACGPVGLAARILATGGLGTRGPPRFATAV